MYSCKYSVSLACYQDINDLKVNVSSNFSATTGGFCDESCAG